MGRDYRRFSDGERFGGITGIVLFSDSFFWFIEVSLSCFLFGSAAG